MGTQHSSRSQGGIAGANSLEDRLMKGVERLRLGLLQPGGHCPLFYPGLIFVVDEGGVDAFEDGRQVGVLRSTDEGRVEPRVRADPGGDVPGVAAELPQGRLAGGYLVWCGALDRALDAL